MHALHIIMARDAAAMGREAAIAELDGNDKLATTIINNRPKIADADDVDQGMVNFDLNRVFWAANREALGEKA